MRPESRRQKRGVNAPASKMIHQEPGAWKLARPVLRGGKPVRVYLSRQQVSPLVTVELLSSSTEEEDLGRTTPKTGKPPTKWQVYEEGRLVLSEKVAA